MSARDGFGQVLRGEWTKLVTVRSTVWCLFLTVGLTILLSIIGAQGSSTNVGDNAERLLEDRFHFMHQPLDGDGTITARVVRQEDTGDWAKAGIMIKQSTEPRTPYVAMLVTPGHGVRFQADFSTDVAAGAGGTPAWLRLTRSGTTITGFTSPDGAAWRQVGTAELAGLPRTAEVGMFAATPASGTRVIRRGGSTTSSPDYEPSTATFDSVRLAPAAGGPAGAWQSDAIGGGVEFADGTTLVGEASESGGVFTVTGTGDIREVPFTERGDDDIVRNALGGVYLGMIAAAVLGVLYVTSEYKTGMIRTTLTASPRRGRVLVAKALLLGTVTFACGLVASLASLLGARPIQRDRGFVPPFYPDPSLTSGTVLRAVFGTAAFLALMALLGLGLGAVIRRTAGAVVAVLALAVVPGIASSLLPVEGEKWLQRLTPLAGLAMQQTRERWDNWVSPWPGFAVACAYVALALAAAVLLIRRRDTA
ncbi:ABC transporter permease subunit [Phytohabitans sp. ZYX-F-186]|uniref:ABC transporter permease subunit n=1 Tax=Phytohabitans maris TaxID=3071409 RepID=A0ABU0ZKX2_9ACTN|nr:ABC transporter permease subunit [Phytohabitans sp. ZYX-F-186]MDQ7907694.1 ABC transporter permease subunit [Phytohabitans sp. ZYX-F-186]